MEILAHRLEGVRQAEGWCDDRPADCRVDLIVVHGISLPAGHFGGPYVEALFTGRLDSDCHPDFADLAGVKVSSHLLIRRDGSLVQFVPFDRRAWHAGESSHCGRTRCNDFSIGIELEGSDEVRYRDEQYEALIAVCQVLLAHYSIDAEQIVGHSDIAPHRKTDPGPHFDWPRLRAGIGG